MHFLFFFIFRVSHAIGLVRVPVRVPVRVMARGKARTMVRVRKAECLADHLCVNIKQKLLVNLDVWLLLSDIAFIQQAEKLATEKFELMKPAWERGKATMNKGGRCERCFL